MDEVAAKEYANEEELDAKKAAAAVQIQAVHRCNNERERLRAVLFLKHQFLKQLFLKQLFLKAAIFKRSYLLMQLSLKAHILKPAIFIAAILKAAKYF